MPRYSDYTSNPSRFFHLSCLNIVQLERSQLALQVLETTTDAKGRKLETIKLPLPPAMHYQAHEELTDKDGKVTRPAGVRLAASYANFYLCNGGLICPAFGGPAQEADKRCSYLHTAIITRGLLVV